MQNDRKFANLVQKQMVKIEGIFLEIEKSTYGFKNVWGKEREEDEKGTSNSINENIIQKSYSK